MTVRRLLFVVGPAGIGKTTLVCRTLKSLEPDQFSNAGESPHAIGIVYLGETVLRPLTFPQPFPRYVQASSTRSSPEATNAVPWSRLAAGPRWIVNFRPFPLARC